MGIESIAKTKASSESKKASSKSEKLVAKATREYEPTEDPKEVRSNEDPSKYDL